MNELISIVIPIYNVELFLPRCLDSVIRQTYSNIEIILVNDGSTDGSGKIAEEYATKDERVYLYNKENGGLSDARNYGIERINGKYLTFIDSDDYVALNYIETLYSLMKKNEADMVIGGSEYVFDETMIDTAPVIEEDSVLNKNQALLRALKVEMRQSAWGKLYKAELFEKIRFPKGKLYEDLAVVFDIINLSNKIVVTNTPLYKYFIRSGSIMQSTFNKKHLDEIEIIETAMSRVKEIHPEYDEYIRARLIYSYFVVLRRILLVDSNDSNLKNYKEELKVKIKNNSKGLYWSKKVKKNLKLKLLFYKFGEDVFMFFQKIADRRNPEVMKK